MFDPKLKRAWEIKGKSPFDHMVRGQAKLDDTQLQMADESFEIKVDGHKGLSLNNFAEFTDDLMVLNKVRENAVFEEIVQQVIEWRVPSEEEAPLSLAQA